MTNDFFDAALNRLALANITVAAAMQMPDNDLLRLGPVGRKTLRVVRTFQGPVMPLLTIANRVWTFHLYGEDGTEFTREISAPTLDAAKLLVEEDWPCAMVEDYYEGHARNRYCPGY